MLYSMPSSDIHDITAGNNYYAAGPGYDLVTGRGTPIIPVVANYLAGSTTTALADNGPSPSTFGQTVSFTATVSPTVPNGETVILEDASNGDAVVGSGTLSNGSATISVANFWSARTNCSRSTAVIPIIDPADRTRFSRRCSRSPPRRT